MLQLRFHFGERDRCGAGSLDAAVMDACARRGVRAAALLRAVEGFGAKQRVRTDRFLSLSEDAPLVVVAVGETRVVEGLADEVRGMASEGVVVLEPVEVLGDGTAAAPGDVVKATIWGPRTGPSAPHLSAVEAMKKHGAQAATVLLGVDGVIDGERRRARFVAGNRGVPGMTIAVGERAGVEAAIAEVDGAAHLVTVEAVELSSPYATGKLHREEARRVTLVTSEIAAGHAHPRYVELIHSLRREGAAGATALRGVWGFRGGGEPHGDRVLALRRDVPLIVEAIDTPEQAKRWRETALSIAGEEDVVHSQSVGQVFALE